MKKSLLLHICCAPDEAWVVHTLKDDFDLHCFFCNPNIQPEEEYEKRLIEARNVATHYSVPFYADTYNSNSWEEAVLGFEHTREGGKRCERCFLLRLRRTAKFCARHSFSAFTTVMSISPHKRIETLNETGIQAANEFGVTYEPFNFKKNNGFQNSITLSNELKLYRQDYCGCRLSKAERDNRKRTKNF